MTTILNPPQTVLNPSQLDAEERFVLHDVSWETYEQLLKNYEDESVPRFTYDHGELEIMSPSQPHEQIGRVLSSLISVICDERTIDFIDLGHMTQRRADLLRGLEPDGCFYIQNAPVVRGVRDLDFRVHPPLDLVIEVDFSSPSIPKLPIYAALGVPEIWHYYNDQITFLWLSEGHYVSVPESPSLPGVLPQDVLRFVTECQTLTRPQWLQAVRQWLHSLPRQ